MQMLNSLPIIVYNSLSTRLNDTKEQHISLLIKAKIITGVISFSSHSKVSYQWENILFKKTS